jgi:hypothetical protein
MLYRFFAFLLFVLSAPQVRAQSPVTFNNQVVRIFQQHCQVCHRPGNIAPFPLLTYQDAIVRTRLIRDAVESKQMPPWKPVNAHGVFKGERALTDQEIQTIVQWASNGAPEGVPADVPPPATFPDTWSMGPPDMVLKPSEPYTLPADSADVYRCFPISLDAQSDVYVRGYEVTPSNRAIVHHVLLFLDELGQSTSLDNADPGPGYTCFGGTGFLIGVGGLGGWVPGSSAEMFPLGTGVRIPKGARVVMQVHYSLADVHSSTGLSSDQAVPSDQTSVGLYFSPTSLQGLSYLPVVNPFFRIPAGESRFQVRAFSIVPSNVDLVGIAPHMHLLGREARVTARFLDGATRELIYINDWDFHWQGSYTFQQPIRLPAGTIIELSAYYDNSANNPKNPSNPPVAVTWGERTTDEMCLTFLTVTATAAPSINTVPFSLSDRSTTSVTTKEASAAATAGYARVSSASGSVPAGLAIFGYRQNGVVISEASVPASGLLTRARVYAELNGAARTGLAIANPGSDPAAISFFFTDSNGQNMNAGTASVPPNSQIAAFLDETPFNGRAPFAGSFTVTSSTAVSVVALRGYLNERSEFLLTTTPVTNLDSIVAADTLFPHFADGGGWTTQVMLVNPTDNVISGTLRFTDPNGHPVSDLSYSIPAKAGKQFLTAGTSNTTSAGSIRIIPSANNAAPAGSLVFSYRVGGIRVTEAGLPASAAGSAFRLYAELSGSTQSGLAITNPSAAAATVQLELISPSGSTVAGGSVIVAANSQVGTFLNQIAGFEGVSVPFRGLLRVTSPVAIAVAGLRGRYNERGEFIITTTPPVSEQPSAAAESYFAHFADGGGFSTQFILFSSAPGLSPGGSIRFVSQAGQALDLKLE